MVPNAKDRSAKDFHIFVPHGVAPWQQQKQVMLCLILEAGLIWASEQGIPHGGFDSTDLAASIYQVKDRFSETRLWVPKKAMRGLLLSFVAFCGLWFCSFS